MMIMMMKYGSMLMALKLTAITTVGNSFLATSEKYM
jgi:hypothetical protein